MVSRLADPPFDIEPQVWAAYLEVNLAHGWTPGPDRNMLESDLSWLLSDKLMSLLDDPGSADFAHQTIADFRKLVEAMARQLTGGDSASSRLYRVVGGREIFEKVAGPGADFTYAGGKLVPLPMDFFEPGTLVNPFDSANYSITAPIYYIQGGRDPATPLWQAQYHFSTQIHAARHLLIIPEAVHEPTKAISDGLEGLWKEMTHPKSEAAWAAAVRKLRNHPVIEFKGPDVEPLSIENQCRLALGTRGQSAAKK